MWTGVDGRGVSPMEGTRGVREVRAAGDGDGIRKADGDPMLPVVLRPASGEGTGAGLVIPQVGRVPLCAPLGKDVEEAQEFHVNQARGRHDAGQKGVSSARSAGIGVKIQRHLGARRALEELVDIGSRSCPLRLTRPRGGCRRPRG